MKAPSAQQAAKDLLAVSRFLSTQPPEHRDALIDAFAGAVETLQQHGIGAPVETPPEAFVGTNALIEEVATKIGILIGYAEADMEGSLDAKARGQAAADRQRMRRLQRALELVEASRKPL